MRDNAFGLARARQDVNLNLEPYAAPELVGNEFGGSMGDPVFRPTFGLNGRRLTTAAGALSSSSPARAPRPVRG